MIRISGLSKSFGEVKALDNLSFSAGNGEILALLGPNGAGKTTLIRLMTGLLSPDAGEIFYDDINIMDHRVEALRRIGYVPENSPLYADMTSFDFLSYTAGLRGIKPNVFSRRLEELVEHLGLAPVVNRRIGTLSKGFRHRVGIAAALIHAPEILILDEPSEGLDPNQKYALQKFIKNFSSCGTVILSTHILEDIEAVASRILLLHNGVLIKDTTPARLKYLMPERSLAAAFRRITNGS